MTISGLLEGLAPKETASDELEMVDDNFGILEGLMPKDAPPEEEGGDETPEGFGASDKVMPSTSVLETDEGYHSGLEDEFSDKKYDQAITRAGTKRKMSISDGSPKRKR